MATLRKKSFDTPDETRTPPKTKVEVVTFGDRSVMKLRLNRDGSGPSMSSRQPRQQAAR